MKLCVRDKKKVVILFGFLLGLVSYFVMMITFFYAFFNGFETLLIWINDFNESYVEAFFIPLGFFVLVLGLYYHLLSLRKEVNRV